MKSSMRRTNAGVTLVELMISIVVALLVLAGVAGFYIYNLNATVAIELEGSMESNLRFGMRNVLLALRNAGYGVPQSNLSTWVPWVTGFSGNPLFVSGGSATAPDTVSVAACTAQPVASLAADAAAGATSLTLDSVSGLDASHRRLIFINDSKSAMITAVSGSSITIDTNPLITGNQGTSRKYLVGTPICRVDVVTYSVDTATKTLRKDVNQGDGPQPIVAGITNLKVATSSAGTNFKYDVTLTGITSAIVPGTGAYGTRSLSSSTGAQH